MWGRLVHTDYKTACLRNILLGSFGVRETDIQLKYKQIGALNEENYEKKLRAANISYLRESPIKVELENTDGVLFSGRADFIHQAADIEHVIELKATDSKNKLRNVIKNGKYVIENLAQLVAYMIHTKTVAGYLIYNFFEQPKGEERWEQKAGRAFHVGIDNNGAVIVDGKATEYTVHDQISHTLTAASVINNPVVWDRPYNWSQPFNSPCGYCPFRATCDKYDSGNIEGVEAFVIDAASQLTLTSKENKDD